MKKRILTAVFVLLLVCVVAVTASAAKVTTVTTGGSNYGFTFTVNDHTLTVSGRVPNEDIYYLAIKANGNYMVNITPDVKFVTTVDLPRDEIQKIDLEVYLGAKLNQAFTGLFFGGDIILEKLDGMWYITLNDKVYEENNVWLSGWLDANTTLNGSQPSAVKMVTSSVISGISDDYAKAEAIHRWVADNVYYDKDYALNTKTSTSITPVEVLTSRVSVCEGYANLAVAMLNSAGIPAVTVKGYSLGVDEPTSWEQIKGTLKANHMWVEAYVDDRWIIMDPTWDSKNMYDKGKKKGSVPLAYRYFDISPEMLASKYRILHRPNVFGKEGASSWALSEAKAAYSKSLITSELLTSMKNKITRKEFCCLALNFLTVKLGKTTEELILERGLELDYGFFADTYDYYVLVANALGVVNGKENRMFDPNGYITRQEAAVMLQRTAKVLGVTTPNSAKFDFSDAAKFPSWSASAIDFVSASVSSAGTRVMGGVENNRFDPTGYYTKEQSVLTIYRLFESY